MTDGEVGKHTHKDAHFCFIVQGVYISRVKDREGVRAASTMLFHPAGTTHCDRFHQRGGRFLTVSIMPERLDRVRDHVDLIDHSIVSPRPYVSPILSLRAGRVPAPLPHRAGDGAIAAFRRFARADRPR